MNDKPLTLVIFGITSNLAQIKILPALYDMAEKDILPKNLNIVGVARSPLEHKEFIDQIFAYLAQENKHHQHEIKPEAFKKLAEKLSYINGNLDDPDFYKKLKGYLDSIEKKDNYNRIFYLATYPDLYHHVFENLQRNSLNKKEGGWVRLMIEKPIGTDLPSAQNLNKLLLNYFTEDQIYRLDHYLGKETLQNILTFRFGNDIFEPMVNSNHIDHIQITASEDFGIGARGGYFDTVGSLKDVGQNHQLQMLAFATMEQPKEFTNAAITEERLKILEKLIPLPEKIVYGQYKGYPREANVTTSSKTDTFYAFKTFIKNDRFKDVPIYIRAGKKLKQTATEISIVFKNPTRKLFKNKTNGDEPNVLIYRIQPNEGIVLKIVTKKPGATTELESEYMQFCYRLDPHSHYIPDPYERLIMDTIKGDQTFFNSAEEVEAQWAFIDPLIVTKKDPEIYEEGSWGPNSADALIEKDGRKWLEPSMAFCRI